ncbi:YncE family protein [Mycobacterium sp.]|uniref:YncE family protein n=1 Tax=Mycobacterium sp. TaxID=1785 RepID=UPI0039C8D140
MPAHRKHGRSQTGLQATGLLLSLLLAAGCSGKTLDETSLSIAPAQPAQSPPLSQDPAGVVHPLGGRTQTAIFDGRTAQLVIVAPGPASAAPASVTLLGAQQTSQRDIALSAPVSGLAGDNGGTAYLSTRGGYFVVDLSAGTVMRVGVRDAENVDFTAITRRSDGTVVLGTADGTLYTLSPGALDDNRIRVHTHIDSLAAQGNTVAVLDRGRTSVTTVGADGKVGQSLRAGQGATTMMADPAGRLLVADTRGGQLLAFGVDPLILRQAYPVADSPYGVVGSRGLAWVSQTAANIVIGYDLSTGIPLEKARYPTVRQPNTLAFDDAAGTLYVVSGAGGGVQVIEHAATGPR